LLIVFIGFGLVGCTTTPGVHTPSKGASKTVTRARGSSRSSQSNAEPSASRVVATRPEAVRLGCHEYCQTAGATGTPSPPSPSDQEEPSDPMLGVEAKNPVAAFDDGTFPLRIYCFVDQKCEGAIWVHGNDHQGASDLLVSAGISRLIAVPLKPRMKSGERIELGGSADAFPTWLRLSREDQDRLLDISLLTSS
jgi:hypothetical protein